MCRSLDTKLQSTAKRGHDFLCRRTGATLGELLTCQALLLKNNDVFYKIPMYTYVDAK